MKFRIKHVPDVGYFAQVKVLFKWETIGRHCGGTWGLYPETHLDHPIEHQFQAASRIEHYDIYLDKLKTQQATYEDWPV